MERQAVQVGEDRIFPYNPKSISERFRRACAVLGIADLHFHDLRHEGTTRLFEQEMSIPEVAAHTLHESWGVLKRYTHLQRRPRLFHAPFLKARVLVAHQSSPRGRSRSRAKGSFDPPSETPGSAGFSKGPAV